MQRHGQYPSALQGMNYKTKNASQLKCCEGPKLKTNMHFSWVFVLFTYIM